jgi:hypothetical protein
VCVLAPDKRGGDLFFGGAGRPNGFALAPERFVTLLG